MSAAKSYEQSYVDACRARSETQVAIFRWARSGADEEEGARFDDLESEYFNNMLLVLDGYFVHRDQARESSQTPALREVRALGEALMLNGGTVLPGEDEGSMGLGILEYRSGDSVRLTADQYSRLSNAFFTEVERHLVDH